MEALLDKFLTTQVFHKRQVLHTVASTQLPSVMNSLPVDIRANSHVSHSLLVATRGWYQWPSRWVGLSALKSNWQWFFSGLRLGWTLGPVLFNISNLAVGMEWTISRVKSDTSLGELLICWRIRWPLTRTTVNQGNGLAGTSWSPTEANAGLQHRQTCLGAALQKGLRVWQQGKLVNANQSECRMAEPMGPLKSSSGTHEISSSYHWLVQSSFYILSLNVTGFLCSSKFTIIVLLGVWKSCLAGQQLLSKSYPARTLFSTWGIRLNWHVPSDSIDDGSNCLHVMDLLT